jgi:hypothetical protein
MAETLKSSMSEPLSYRDAGVDIDEGDALVEAIKPLARRTLRPEVLAGIGGFGALCEIPKRYRQPVLVSGTDGVGTKLKLAFALGKHDTVGIDLVAMSVQRRWYGRRAAFLPRLLCLRQARPARRDGSGEGHRARLRAGLLADGGETAEMPGMYPQGEYDLPASASGWSRRTASSTVARSRPRRDSRACFERPALQRLLAHPQDLRVERRRSICHDANLREADPAAHRINASQGLGAYHRRRAGGQRAARVPPRNEGTDPPGCLAAPAGVPVAAKGGQRRRRRDVARVQLRHRHGGDRRGRARCGSASSACRRNAQLMGRS